MRLRGKCQEFDNARIQQHDQKLNYCTMFALRDPDVEVEAVFAPKNRGLLIINLETLLSKPRRLQDPWWWTNRDRFSFPANNMVEIDIYIPSQPGWGLGFSKTPGLAAKGIPLKTSTERNSSRGIFCPWTRPPSVWTTPSWSNNRTRDL